MTGEILVAGGGIGGLAAALAARRAGWEVRLLEQAQAFSEVGAGIQLGPNATSILRDWDLLQGSLGERVARPQRLCVCDASTGAELGALRLGQHFEQRYGAPYCTVHRADLQQALLDAARGVGVRLLTAARVESVRQAESVVQVRAAAGPELEADAVVAADGLWGRVREQVLGDGPPRFTGHVAYRGLARQADLPVPVRSSDVTVWLGQRMHVVRYPVRGGEWLNVVCLVEGRFAGDARGWDHEAVVADLEAATAGACAPVRELVRAIAYVSWRRR